MLGRWTQKAYRIAHDGSTIIIHLADGLQVLQGERSFHYRMELVAHSARDFLFHPDNKYVVFWAPVVAGRPRNCVGFMRLTELASGEPQFQILYQPEEGRQPFGMEWSPTGECLYVIERVREDRLSYTVIQRIDLKGPKKGKPQEIVRRLGLIDFFMPPVSRFEAGQGPQKAPYKIVYGTARGLILCGPNGEDEVRIAQMPALGLQNVEWSPKLGVNQLLLHFRHPTPGPYGSQFKGTYLLDLDKMKGSEDPDDYLENLYERTDVHTLWFSPKGTYMTWASPSTLRYRKPEDPVSETVEIEREIEGGDLGEIRGAYWNNDETKLLYTAEGEVLVHDLKKPVGKRDSLVASFPKGFAAQPRWVGQRIFVTVYEDVSAERAAARANTETCVGPPLGLKPVGSPKK